MAPTSMTFSYDLQGGSKLWSEMAGVAPKILNSVSKRRSKGSNIQWCQNPVCGHMNAALNRLQSYHK